MGECLITRRARRKAFSPATFTEVDGTFTTASSQHLVTINANAVTGRTSKICNFVPSATDIYLFSGEGIRGIGVYNSGSAMYCYFKNMTDESKTFDLTTVKIYTIG